MFSDQRTEYRLERRKKERNTENKEQAVGGVRRQDTDTMEGEREDQQAGDFAGGAEHQVRLRVLVRCVTQD